MVKLSKQMRQPVGAGCCLQAPRFVPGKQYRRAANMCFAAVLSGEHTQCMLRRVHSPRPDPNPAPKPLKEAAALLGVSVSVLRQMARDAGLTRWPNHRWTPLPDKENKLG